MPTLHWPPPSPTDPLAVLVSGGLDSSVLIAEAAAAYPAVFPIYVRTNSAWELEEVAHLDRFLDQIARPTLRPKHVLNLPMDDLYGSHWSVTGVGVPDETSPDEAVYLPGRNVALLAKTLIWCHLNGVPQVAMAPLSSNPFPDATPAFFAALVTAVNMAVRGNVTVIRPYQSLTKAQVIRRGREFPLIDTLSCIRPVAGRHCGRCNKCAERQAAFIAAEVYDPTEYAPTH